MGAIESFQVTGGIEEAKSLIGDTARLEFKERTCTDPTCLNFTDADLTGATIAPWHHFPETIFHNTTLPDGTVKTDSPNRRLLIQLYVDGAPEVALAGRDFSGWDLRGVELQNRNLAKCNFTGADLRNIKLAGANLTQANLRNAIGFIPADHEGIILQKATLPNGTIGD